MPSFVYIQCCQLWARCSLPLINEPLLPLRTLIYATPTVQVNSCNPPVQPLVHPTDASHSCAHQCTPALHPTYEPCMLGIHRSHGPDAQHPLCFSIPLHPCCHRGPQAWCSRGGARAMGGGRGQPQGRSLQLEALVSQAQEVVVQSLEEVFWAGHLLHCALHTMRVQVPKHPVLKPLLLHTFEVSHCPPSSSIIPQHCTANICLLLAGARASPAVASHHTTSMPQPRQSLLGVSEAGKLGLVMDRD